MIKLGLAVGCEDICDMCQSSLPVLTDDDWTVTQPSMSQKPASSQAVPSSRVLCCCLWCLLLLSTPPPPPPSITHTHKRAAKPPHHPPPARHRLAALSALQAPRLQCSNGQWRWRHLCHARKEKNGERLVTECICCCPKMADDDDWMNEDISIAVPSAPEVTIVS